MGAPTLTAEQNHQKKLFILDCVHGLKILDNGTTENTQDWMSIHKEIYLKEMKVSSVKFILLLLKNY